MQVMYEKHEPKETAQQRMAALFPTHAEEALRLHEEDAQIAHLSPYEAAYLYSLISDYFDDKERVWQVFRRAAKVGVFFTESRFEAVEQTVGEALAPEVIYDSTVNGYLLCPEVAEVDPERALACLKKRFDEKTCAEILAKNQEFLRLFKAKYHTETAAESAERASKIQMIIKKYNREADKCVLKLKR